MLDAHVDEAALAGDALAVDDVELGLLNGGATLFLTTLTRARLPDDLGAFFQRPMRRTSSRTEE